jgi:YVTN family beta-propeller protein
VHVRREHAGRQPERHRNTRLELHPVLRLRQRPQDLASRDGRRDAAERHDHVRADDALGTGVGSFAASGNGNGFAWNFDGGAAPATGSSVNATFNAAGSFTVRLTATRTQGLAASGFDNGNLVNAARNFLSGDPSPDARVVSVQMPADVDFRNYETAHVHPLGLSASHTQLYALNTPENRLAIFTASGGTLTFAGDVPVGLEPVSLAVRPGTSEVWVVNHLSDDVSIVDVAAKKLVATIAVGDEPNDVVFASNRAFVTLAGNDDRVKVYDAATRAQVASLAIFAEKPRALAVNAAGTRSMPPCSKSGNQTTELFEDLVSAGGGPPRRIRRDPRPWERRRPPASS